ncbi:FAD-dependent oxidoreductase [Aeromicrobium sp.]|nr:FAD-dependent oxidoreductase [Candidatus Saccharibacteria bacterium]
MQLTFVKREELSPCVWEYYFKPERAIDYVPGQYIDVILDNVEDDPRGRGRVFTLTSLPSDELLSFVVKFQEPVSLYKQYLELLQEGDRAHCNNAMGDLILPKDTARPLVFVAGGIGIASYASMLKKMLAKREERDVYLFYALRSKYEQIFKDLLNSYPLQLKTIVIAPNRLSAQQIMHSSPPNALIYLSGSERFVEGLSQNLETLGVDQSQMVYDYFEGYDEL